MEEYMLLGIDVSEGFEVLYTGSKEECYAEFDVALNDQETQLNYMTLAVVRNLRQATLTYDIKEYPEESSEVVAADDPSQTGAHRPSFTRQPSC